VAKYKVEEGESLLEIGEDHGVPYTAFYDKKLNSDLKKLRPNPNLLAPGEDSINLPEKGKKQVTAKTGDTKKLQVQKPPLRKLKLRLMDSDGKPLKSKPCKVAFPPDDPAPYSSDGSGILEIPLPDEVKAKGDKGRHLGATLTVGDPEEHSFQLRLRFLRPLQDVADQGVRGAKARLRNLGYAVTSPESPIDGATHVALAVFQADNGLEVDGKLSDDTLKKLEEVHGC
jgi:hypothetical protein